MAKDKKLHGNSAKIDPKKRVEGINSTNMAVPEGKIRPNERKQMDELVEYSRNFVDENKL